MTRFIYGSKASKKKPQIQVKKGGTSSPSLEKAVEELNLLQWGDLKSPLGGFPLGQSGMVSKEDIDGTVVDPEKPVLHGPTILELNETAKYVITNYDSFTNYSVTTANGVASREADVITYTGILEGTGGITVNGKTLDIRIGGTYPVTPSLLFPVNGSSDVLRVTTFVCSEFSIADPEDKHLSTDWEVSKNPEFQGIVASSIGDTVNKVTWTPPILERDTTFFVRVRHRATSLKYSDWSETSVFRTTEVEVSTPVIVSPTPNAPAQFLTLEIASSPFELSKGSDIHESSEWELSKDQSFASVLYSSANVLSERTAWTPPRLEIDTDYYVRVRYKGRDYGYSAWSTPRLFRTINVLVGKPAITMPVEGSTPSSLSVSMMSSAFTITGDTDVHVSTDWQLSKTADFINVVHSSIGSASNKTLWTPPRLESNTSYYVRVRYLTAKYGYSEWSDPVSFKTILVTLATPSVVSPVNGDQSVSIYSTITGSAFTISGETDTHASSDWQVSTTEDFSSIVVSSINDTVNKTSWKPSGLVKETVYFIRVRYKAANNGYTAWSAPIQIRTRFSRVLNISPAWNGKTAWDLETDGPLDIAGNHDIYNDVLGNIPKRKFAVTVQENVTLDFDIWGGGGAASMRGTPSGGGGAYVGGRTTLTPGTTYYVSAATKAHNSETWWVHIGGAWVNDDNAQGAGGGLSGLFRGSINPAESLAVAGGGGGAGAYSGSPGREQITTSSGSFYGTVGDGGGGGGFTGGSGGKNPISRWSADAPGDGYTHIPGNPSSGGSSYVNSSYCTNIVIQGGSGRNPGNAAAAAGYGNGGTGGGNNWTPGRVVLK